MVSSELSDKKPGIVTGFTVLLAMIVAAVIVLAILFMGRNNGTYDTDRVNKRYENLKKLNSENTKKTTEFAVLDKTKGVYQLPLKNAIALTARDLSKITPHSAYPIATPEPPAAPPAPAASPGAESNTASPPAAQATPATGQAAPATPAKPAENPASSPAATP